MPLFGRTSPSGYAFVPAGSPAGWWKADAITGLVDGNAVGTWVDSSGNDRNLTQSTAANKPTYKTNIQNGLPVVRFDGVNDSLASQAFTLEQPVHIFVVLAQLSWTANDFLFDGDGSTTMALYQRSSTPNIAMAAGVASGAGPNTTSLTIGNFGLLTCLFNSTSSSIRYNGVTKIESDAGDRDGNGVTLGCPGTQNSLWGHLDIAEFLIYNSALSDADRNANEAGLMSKWGLS